MKKVLVVGAGMMLLFLFLYHNVQPDFFMQSDVPIPEAVSVQNLNQQPAMVGREKILVLQENFSTDVRSDEEGDRVVGEEFDDRVEEPTLSAMQKEVNLYVPFSSQAPYADWGMPWQEACEEASALMAYAAFQNNSLSKEKAKEEIIKIVEWEKNRFGYYEDTTAAQTAEMIRDYFQLRAEVRRDVTVDAIKNELSKGHLVLVPAAGRLLPNPYFRSPGPIYHMVVIRGFTATHFITNDPGTKRGESFLYTHEALLRAVHDWNDGDVEHGDVVMIVVSP